MGEASWVPLLRPVEEAVAALEAEREEEAVEVGEAQGVALAVASWGVAVGVEVWLMKLVCVAEEEVEWLTERVIPPTGGVAVGSSVPSGESEAPPSSEGVPLPVAEVVGE